VNIQNRAEQITVLPAEVFAPVTEVDVPPGLANLPERPGLFVGRAAELARLDAALAGPGGVVVQAVHGPGRHRQEHAGHALGRQQRRPPHPDLVDHRRQPSWN